MKHSLLDRKQEVKQLNLDEKRYYGELVNSQDDTSFEAPMN